MKQQPLLQRLPAVFRLMPCASSKRQKQGLGVLRTEPGNYCTVENPGAEHTSLLDVLRQEGIDAGGGAPNVQGLADVLLEVLQLLLCHGVPLQSTLQLLLRYIPCRGADALKQGLHNHTVALQVLWNIP